MKFNDFRTELEFGSMRGVGRRIHAARKLGRNDATRCGFRKLAAAEFQASVSAVCAYYSAKHATAKAAVLNSWPIGR